MLNCMSACPLLVSSSLCWGCCCVISYQPHLLFPVRVLQVVDARDPLTYFSRDLVAYANQLHATKSSFILLNKADLLPEAVRTAWADYFDSKGLQYGFFSAFVASEAQAKARHDAIALGLAVPDPAAVARYFRELLGLADADGSSGGGSSSRTRILSVDEMLVVLEGLARQAVDAADEDDPRRWVAVQRMCFKYVS